jgi:hypothetical protein
MRGTAMALHGKVVSAAPGLIGFDTDTKLTAAKAKDFYNRGFRFCVRYLTRSSDKPSPGDISQNEAALILKAGLALGAVQHVAPRGWKPSAALGKQYGRRAADSAKAASLPAGMNLWLDLEGVSSTSSHQDVIDYCNTWFDVVEADGYVSGLYVGAETILSGTELFLKLKTRHYWKSGSTVPDIPHRGYQMVQYIEQDFDRDVTANDHLGDAVLWLAPQ